MMGNDWQRIKFVLSLLAEFIVYLGVTLGTFLLFKAIFA